MICVFDGRFSTNRTRTNKRAQPPPFLNSATEPNSLRPKKKRKKRTERELTSSSGGKRSKGHHRSKSGSGSTIIARPSETPVEPDAQYLEEIRDIATLSRQLQQQNQVLKDQIVLLRSIFIPDSIQSESSDSWKASRMDTEELLRSELLDKEIAVTRCWKLVDECERMSRTLQGTRHHLFQEVLHREEAKQEISRYTSNIIRLREELSNLRKKCAGQEAVIEQLVGREMKRNSGHFNLRNKP